MELQAVAEAAAVQINGIQDLGAWEFVDLSELGWSSPLSFDNILQPSETRNVRDVPCTVRLKQPVLCSVCTNANFTILASSNCCNL